MAAARDVKPVCERYMIDYNNKSADIHQAIQDRIHWFSMDYAGRGVFREIATNIYGEPLAFRLAQLGAVLQQQRVAAPRCACSTADDIPFWVW